MRKTTSKDLTRDEIRILASKALHNSKAKLCVRELTAVHALVSYVSYNLKIEESEIIKMTCKSFGVSKIENIPQASYNELIFYIIEFTHPSTAKN